MPPKPRATVVVPHSSPQVLDLKAVVIDLTIQPRVRLDYEVINEYTELYRAVTGTDDDPDILPPLKVMTVDEVQFLTDGFHRHAAAQRAGRTTLRCVVSAGTRQEAIREAALANVKHGLPYTRQDREQVLDRLLDDPIYGVKTTRELGAELGISHTTVQRFKDRRQAAQTIIQTAPDVATLAREVGIVEEDKLAVLAQTPLDVSVVVAEAVKRVVNNQYKGSQETLVPQALEALKTDLAWRATFALREQHEDDARRERRRATHTPEARAVRQAEKEAEATKQAADAEKEKRESHAWQVEALVGHLARVADHADKGTWPAGRTLADDVAAVHQGDQRRIARMLTQAACGLALLIETCEAAGWNVQRVRDAALSRLGGSSVNDTAPDTEDIPDTVTDTDHALESFDTTKYRLGKLCPRGHDYHGTGQSLRVNNKAGYCLACNAATNQRKRAQARQEISA